MKTYKLTKQDKELIEEAKKLVGEKKVDGGVVKEDFVPNILQLQI